MNLSVRRLTEEDAPVFRAMRREGFALHPREFRYAPEDEDDVPLASTNEVLRDDFVVGGFADGELAGLVGLRRFKGVKIAHKGLLFGMYVREPARGSGLADMLMKEILDGARGELEFIFLTLAGGNERARRFYERWGFRSCGVDPQAIKFGAGDYLDEELMQLKLV
jgi:GNAT superfamily N-acetyltransferase